MAQVRIDPDLVDELRAAADTEGMSLSAYVNRVLRDGPISGQDAPGAPTVRNGRNASIGRPTGRLMGVVRFR